MKYRTILYVLLVQLMADNSNPFFNKAREKARKMADNPGKVKETVDKAMKKSNLIDNTKDKARELKNNLGLLFQMLGAYFSGKYKKLPMITVVKILAAVIYFLFVTDLIPDFFAVIGLVDDAAVVAWVLNSIKGDLEAFKAWRNAQGESAETLLLEEQKTD